MSERGGASVEFLGISAVAMIPVLYIMLTIGQVSAGAMVVDVEACEAVRTFAEDPGRTAGANHAVTLIVEDSGVNMTPEVVSTCGNYQNGEGAVDARVSMQIPLPPVPAWLSGLGVGVPSSARVPVREVVARE